VKTLIFGKSGQVATELARQGKLQGNVIALGRAECDLTDPVLAKTAISDHAPDVVINAAAYTAVDAAEDNEAAALAINATAPGVMAQACSTQGIPLIHISTDYVFDGSGQTPWQPASPVMAPPMSPLGAYGRTKLAGEIAVRRAGGVHVILRTSWVFSSHGENFVKTMLRLGAGRDGLNVVADQIGGPTPAADIAGACLAIARQIDTDPAKSGIYHYAGGVDVSWADFAREIFTQANLPCAVTDIPSSAYPTPAARPGNSRLDMTTTTDTFGLPRPDWRKGLAAVLKEPGK